VFKIVCVNICNN